MLKSERSEIAKKNTTEKPIVVDLLEEMIEGRKKTDATYMQAIEKVDRCQKKNGDA